MFRLTALFMSLLAALLAVPAIAGARVELSSTVEVVRAVKQPDGRVVTSLEIANRVVPGDELKVTVRYTNAGDRAAEEFQITNPVSSAMLPLIADDMEVSIDGGNRYGTLASLIVNDSGVSRPATPADVTHVRWTLADPLEAGASGEVSFRARLK